VHVKNKESKNLWRPSGISIDKNTHANAILSANFACIEVQADPSRAIGMK